MSCSWSYLGSVQREPIVCSPTAGSPTPKRSGGLGDLQPQPNLRHHTTCLSGSEGISACCAAMSWLGVDSLPSWLGYAPGSGSCSVPARSSSYARSGGLKRADLRARPLASGKRGCSHHRQAGVGRPDAVDRRHQVARRGSRASAGPQCNGTLHLLTPRSDFLQPKYRVATLELVRGAHP